MSESKRDKNADREQQREAFASQHHHEWRDQAQVVAQWGEAGDIDPRLFEYRVKGDWWSVVAESKATLLITREYEHLVLALNADGSTRRISYMTLPHPSGLVADRKRNIVHIASSRNPNQVFDLAPISGFRNRLDMPEPDVAGDLVPIRSRFFPGCLYLHDLALIGDALHGNAVGENSIVRFDELGGASRVWWPRCIEQADGPIFGRNHLQLNSIAAGSDLAGSFFSASADRITRYRPGHLKFPVDRTGVIFSGKTREPVAGGLTRPHSARLNQGVVWVDNSGYGEVGLIRDDRYELVVKLPGWTRGLSFHGDFAFVGTSRVLPRFRSYAPGLDVDSSVCGLHAIDMKTGKVRGSMIWPWGNQIFAIDWLPQAITSGFPWLANRKRPTRTKQLFYAFTTAKNS